MRHYKSQNRWDVIGFFLRSCLTLLAAGILALRANGYEIDFQNVTWQKAGMIVINADPTDAHLTVDGEPSPLSGRERTILLAPRTYTVSVQKEGLTSWQQTVRVEAGRASTFSALLFWIEPKLLGTRTAQLEDHLQKPNTELLIRDSELWFMSGDAPRLITRFSQAITTAVLLDRDHVLLQLGATLHVVDVNGSNDRRLINLVDAEPVNLLVRSGGQIIDIVKGEAVTTYALRP